jgi:hypothetical protein
MLPYVNPEKLVQARVLGALLGLCLHTARCRAGIKYQLMIPNATVQLGSQSYTNVQVMFTFVGDDSNVFSGTIPDPALPAVLTYSAIYQGVASVTIISSGGTCWRARSSTPIRWWSASITASRGLDLVSFPAESDPLAST